MSNLSQFNHLRRAKNEKKWYAMAIEDVLADLSSSASGLDDEEVSTRQKQHGKNILPEGQRRSRWNIFLSQFKSSLVYVLLAAALASALLRDFIDAGVILLAVIINVVIGFYQENKAAAALNSLKKVVVNFCKVLRDGHEKQIKTAELVPGDIVFLSPGDKIPADLRLLKVTNFKTNEAPLTGESAEIDKTAKILTGNLVIADQSNIAFMGTAVTQGNSIGVVIATAGGTALGRIAALVASTDEMLTPLQRKLAIFSRKISILLLAICGLIFISGLILGQSFIQIFSIAIAIAVSAIPEGLLVTVTVILAVGMQRILKDKALAKHLLAAEILGSTSVICSDKTGTLTEGEMRVVELATHDYTFDFIKSNFNSVASQAQELLQLLKIGFICNNSYIENQNKDLEHWIVRGTPTEKALLLAGSNMGFNKIDIDKQEERLDEIPFDSSWKYMATLNRRDRVSHTIYLKGAPEIVLGFSTHIFSAHSHKNKIEINDKHKAQMRVIYEDMSRRGLRVIAVAYKHVPSTVKKLDHADQSGYIFVGLMGIKDPLRGHIKNTVAEVKRAGIRTIMITGDHKLTAAAIAADIGLPYAAKNIMDGARLATLNESQLLEIVEDITVYARVTSEDKLKIIKAWQDKGKIVAMTGDGINDAPALKKANIGIAVGSGTDVAKETADIILLDDNYKTIVAAVREGRVIFDNIKKIILYFLSNSFAEILAITVAMLFNWPLPLLAAQIIWVNLVNDTFPALAMTQEPADDDIMEKKPRRLDEPILNKEAKFLIGLVSSLLAIGILFLFGYFRSQFENIDLARTIAFTFLSVNALFYVFSIRNLSRPIWQTNLLNNKFLLASVVIGFALQMLAIYHPWMQKIFHTIALGFAEWMVVISACLLLVGILEVIKKIYYKRINA